MPVDSEMGGEPEGYSEPKDGLKRKIDQCIELAKQKALELAARLNKDPETKRARLEPQDASNVTPAGAFSQPSFYDNSSYGSTPTSKTIPIPNDKVGLIIGMGGDTIKRLQLQSGARIQITKDAKTNPNMATRDVDLVGTADQVSRAEELIHSVIAEVDASGSAPGAARGITSDPTGGGQFVMKVPDNKVGLIIGKGGEMIKTIQNRSGANMQIVPLRPPPNENLIERSVFINGTQEQIDSAQEMINDIVREGRLRVPPVPRSHMQPAYSLPATWVPPEQAPKRPYQTGYEYSAPGAYPPPASHYGGYGINPQAGWDQSNHSSVPPPQIPLPQQSAGYNYYGQADQTGSGPPTYNYGYGQPQAPVPSQSGNQGYPTQPASYRKSYPGQPLAVNQQNTYSTTPGYGQPPTSELAAAQPTQTLPPYPVAYNYNQGTNTHASYGTQQSYTAPPTSQPAYETSYPTGPHPAYGAQQGYSANPAYGAQQGYSANPAYGAQQGYSANPAYGAQQGYPANPAYGVQQGYSSNPAYGAQQGYSSNPAYGAQQGYSAQPPQGQSAYPPQPAAPAYVQSQPNPPTQPEPPSQLNGDASASR